MRSLIALALVCAPAFAGYASKATVTFAAATGSTQTNITLAFTGSDAKLKSVANSGQLAASSTRAGVTVPNDFVFTSDATCATIAGGYTWGFESWDQSAGTITGWLMVPSLTTGAAVSPTVCIGLAADTYHGGAQGAEYDTSTKAAFHLGEASLGNGATSYDSSASANNLTTQSSNGTTFSAAATGKVGGALNLPNNGGTFAGAYALTASASGIGTGHTSAEGWVKFTSVTSSDTIHVAVFASAGGYPYNDFGITTNSTTTLVLAGATSAADTAHYTASTATLSAGTWYHLAVVYDGATLTVYVNGSFSVSAAGAWARGADSPIGLNNIPSGDIGGRFSTAVFDEIRFASTDRTANWIATEYANQNAPPAIGAFSAITSGGTSHALMLGVGE